MNFKVGDWVRVVCQKDIGIVSNEILQPYKGHK